MLRAEKIIKINAKNLGWLSLAIIFVIGGSLSSSGFCFSQARYLDDKEFFEFAVGRQSKSIRELSELQHKITFEDVMSYVTQHPDCCKIMGSDFFLANNFFEKLINFKTIWVQVHYELSNAEVQRLPRDGHLYEAFVGLSSCGDVRRSIGIRLDRF